MALLFSHHPDTIARLTPTQMRQYHRWIEQQAESAGDDTE